MAGVCLPARVLAERMARAYVAACGAEPGGDVLGPLVQMLLPAAEVVAETRALAVEISARLDAHAGVLAESLMAAAERAGELDAAGWPGVLAAGERVRREFVPGGDG